MAENVSVMDPLYQSYCLPLDGVLQHKYVLRGKSLGMAALPLQWVRGQHFGKTCDPSLFEHSCGLARLALGICAKNQIQTLDFVVAAFLRGIGQTAFAYLGEQRLMGYNAGERAAQLVMEDSLAALVRKAGANPVAVAAIMRGREPYGPLLMGESSIETLDSALRFAMRYGIVQTHVYRTLEIAKAFKRTPRGWVVEAAVLPQLERYKFVMQHNWQVACGTRFLGRAALLRRALDAYQAQTGALVKLLSGTDLAAAENLRRTPVAAAYIKMLDEDAPLYHVGDVPAPGVNPSALRKRVAAQVHLPEDCILAEGPCHARAGALTLTLSNGQQFHAAPVVPAVLRVYATLKPRVNPEPRAWL
ncbi:MAG: hypothetical protein ABSE73_08760 [Planctomycetota bacterium]